jgi:signal transduction histidine kinase
MNKGATMISTSEYEPSREQLQAEVSSSQNCIECLKLQLEQAHRNAQTTAATAAAAAVERELLLASERESHAQLQADARLKDEFLANLSHELRTPIGAIQGWSQLIRPGESSVAELTEATHVIERNTRHLLQLVEDLLDMSRVVSGKMKIAAQEVDLVEIIRCAVESFAPAAVAKHVTVQTAIDSAIAMVSGDAARLAQVVWNLLSNAIKFTPENGSVQVELEHVNAHVELSIIDSGIGISQAFLPFVFDRFRQADCSSTRKQGGLGLGLAIVKSLVELHGGSVRVKSQGVGRGTTFVVVLPNSRAAPQADVHEPNPAPEDLPALNDLRVLMVDDDTDGTDPLARALARKSAVSARPWKRCGWSNSNAPMWCWRTSACRRSTASNSPGGCARFAARGCAMFRSRRSARWGDPATAAAPCSPGSTYF